MNKQSLLGLAFSGLLAIASGINTAEAQSKVVWSCDAMAAEPAGAPIAADLHDSLAGIVRFKDGKTGNIGHQAVAALQDHQPPAHIGAVARVRDPKAFQARRASSLRGRGGRNHERSARDKKGAHSHSRAGIG